MKTEKKDVKTCFNDNRSKHICMTVCLGAETQFDKVSITNVTEKLDIGVMLERAQQGILDLRTFQKPMTADYAARGNDEQVANETKQLLNEPDSPLNRVFGIDRETAEQSLASFARIANDNMIAKKEENDDEGAPEHREGVTKEE